MSLHAIPDRADAPDVSPRVLVVEDEFLIRMLVSDELREAGFTVIEALNGDEAVDILESGAAIDVVFTDVRMPGSVDGLSLLAFVKRTRPDLPVIITSGHLEPERAYSGGAVRFMPKPFDFDRVALALRSALRDAA